MFPTVGNCFPFSQKNKGTNEILNCVLDDVRIGDQLCLLMTSLHLAAPKPLMLSTRIESPTFLKYGWVSDCFPPFLI